MSKYIIYADDGMTPVMEFDAEKENPHFYEMLKRGGNTLGQLNDINKSLSNRAPGFLMSVLLFLRHLKQLNAIEANLHQVYDKNVKPILNEMKNFIISPKLSVTHGAFSTQFQNEALSQTRLLIDDTASTYDRILNRCIAIRSDLLAKLSIGLAILSIILGVIGAASLFK